MPKNSTTGTTKAVVLISGNGTNLQAIIDKCDGICLKIMCVISDKADAFGLRRAKSAGLTTQVITPKNLVPESFDTRLIKSIDIYEPDLIILAGFMRILGPVFTQKYRGKVLNLHPSLLPKFRGLNTHKRAIAAGEKTHGASVHFVNEKIDGGTIIAQKELSISPNDTENTLAKKVLVAEHQLYPEVISWFTKGRLCLKNERAYLDGQILTKAIKLR